MPVLTRPAVRRRRRSTTADAGTTLPELMVSMALLGTVLLLVVAGLSDMYQSAGRTEALNDAQDGLHATWQRLHREVRYASAVGAPQQVAADAGNWHVAVAAPGACVELRVNAAAQSLERRDRTAGTAWRTLAAGVVPAAGQAPFVRDVDAGSGHQQLGLRLSLAGTGTQSATQRSTQMDLVALNSSATSALPSTCAVAP